MQLYVNLASSKDTESDQHSFRIAVQRHLLFVWQQQYLLGSFLEKAQSRLSGTEARQPGQRDRSLVVLLASTIANRLIVFGQAHSTSPNNVFVAAQVPKCARFPGVPAADCPFIAGKGGK